MDIATAITIATALLMAAGVIFSLRRNIPGPLLVLAGAALYGIFFRFERIGLGSLALLALTALIAYIPDLFSGFAKEERGEPSYQAGLGAVVGGFLGFIMFGAVGAVAGIFVGTLMAELVFAENSLANSVKIALSGLMSFLTKRFAKMMISIAMVITFLATLL